ncbi:MAG: biopolymer transporter ExbD [Aquificota bacterium]|jgi:biopolymer transport protein ExbD
MKIPKHFLEERPRLEVVPIVDVLLAVFLFLAIIAFKSEYVSVFVQLPQGEGQQANFKIVKITMDKEGKIYIEGKKYTIDQLKEYLKKKTTLVVNVLADKETPYKYVAQLLAILQKEGITNVNLILKKQ